MPYHYQLQTLMAWDERDEPARDIVDRLCGRLDEPMAQDSLEQEFKAATRGLEDYTVASVFIGDDDQDWLVWASMNGRPRDSWPAVCLPDGSSWTAQEDRIFALEGAPSTVSKFTKRWGVSATDINPFGLCRSGAELEELCPAFARLASNEEPIGVADWVEGPVLIEIARGRYRVRPLRLEDDSIPAAVLERLASGAPEGTTDWVSVKPSVPKKTKSKNPLRRGSMKQRCALADKADRMPSKRSSSAARGDVAQPDAGESDRGGGSLELSHDRLGATAHRAA